VELPVYQPPKTPPYVGKILSVQTDFQDLPFLVVWPDGERTEGVIKAHLLKNEPGGPR
jgi:hypothetical protein